MKYSGSKAREFIYSQNLNFQLRILLQCIEPELYLIIGNDRSNFSYTGSLYTYKQFKDINSLNDLFHQLFS